MHMSLKYKEEKKELVMQNRNNFLGSKVSKYFKIQLLIASRNK